MEATTTDASSEADVSDYLQILRRRWLVIAGTAIIAMVVVGSMGLTETPVYEASAQLLLQPKQSESIFTPGVATQDATRALQNELTIINSLRVRKAVEAAYGAPIDISAASAGDDDIILMSATDVDPKKAAEKVNVYAQTYQTARLNALLADLADSKAVIQQQINDFQKQVDAVDKPLADLDAKIVTLPTDSAEYASLVTQRTELKAQIAPKKDELQSQLNDYQQRLQILQLSERLTTTGGVQILNPATPPSAPISPNVMRSVIQAGLIGLFVGVALALVLDQLDDSIRTTAELQRSARDLPTLGIIPRDETWKNRDEARLSTISDPMSAIAEAFRSLRTSLQYFALSHPVGVIQVQSATAGEGKSSVSANLAVAFAQAGMDVVVIGCDLRRPRIHRYLGVDPSIGLTSVLLNTHRLDEALQQSPIHENIRVLPSGPRPPNPSELLSLDRTEGIIRSVCGPQTVVLLDCAPVLPVTDSLVLTRCVDASLFVVSCDHTSRRDVRHSMERLRQVNNPVIGTILNGVPDEGVYGSMYEYYGYGRPSGGFLRRLFSRRRQTDVPMTADDAELLEDSPLLREQPKPTMNGHAADGVEETRPIDVSPLS